MSFLYDPPILQPSATSSGAALERALREQQTLLDSAGAGIVFIRQRLVVRANPRYAEIFGYASHHDLVGQTSESFYPNRNAFRALGRAAYPVVSQGKTYRTEQLMRRRDGSLFWGCLTGTLINPQDTSEGSIWIIDDIDKQKNAQVQLDAALREKQALLENAMVGIVFLHQRRLTHCNRHFEQMLGYGPGELAGSLSQRWYYHDTDWEAVGRESNAALAQGRSFEGELTLRKKDGTPVACEVRCKAIHPTKPEDGTVWITLDITERRQAQAELARIHGELERLVQERTGQLRDTVNNLHREINDRRQDQERIYWLAHYDPLTGLPNRTLLAERSQKAIEMARQEQSPLAVIFLDLDHFKHVNDSLGHRVGDALLVAIAKTPARGGARKRHGLPRRW